MPTVWVEMFLLKIHKKLFGGYQRKCFCAFLQCIFLEFSGKKHANENDWITLFCWHRRLREVRDPLDFASMLENNAWLSSLPQHYWKTSTYVAKIRH